MDELRSHDHVLHTFLAEHDAACPGCGYNLRGLSGDSCPECHQPVYIGMFLGLGSEAITPALFYAVRAWLLALTVAGVVLLAMHLTAAVWRAGGGGAGAGGGGAWGVGAPGFTRGMLVRMALGMALSLAPAAALSVWESRQRTLAVTSPEGRRSRAAWAIGTAAGALLMAVLLLI